MSTEKEKSAQIKKRSVNIATKIVCILFGMVIVLSIIFIPLLLKPNNNNDTATESLEKYLVEWMPNKLETDSAQEKYVKNLFDSLLKDRIKSDSIEKNNPTIAIDSINKKIDSYVIYTFMIKDDVTNDISIIRSMYKDSNFVIQSIKILYPEMSKLSVINIAKNEYSVEVKQLNDTIK